jgi:hypothetical protein
MGWQPRPGGSYFYRSVRIAGRVTKQYFGRGAAATLAKSFDDEARERRQEERETLQAERARFEPIDRATADLDAACRRLVEATLHAAGFHQHRYTWRRIRERPGRRST